MVIRLDSSPTPRQRSPRTDPSMRDGDSGHGNPGDDAADRNALDSDADTGDTDGLEHTFGAVVDGGMQGGEREREAEFEDLVEEFEGDDQSLDPVEVAALGLDAPAPEPATAAVTPTGDVPIRDYRRLNVAEVMKAAAGLPAADRDRVLAFEKANRNRKTLVARLERLSGKD